MSVQDLQTVIGGLGGLAGVGAFLTAMLGRKKFRAEAADVITDTALTLVEPLQRRVKEVTEEAREAREETRQARDETRQARDEMNELRGSLTEVLTMLRRWRTAVLTPSVSREELAQMVRSEPVDTGSTA